nr:MAG TPA: hypothetical protein [Caudoviricetes sp.]
MQVLPLALDQSRLENLITRFIHFFAVSDFNR